MYVSETAGVLGIFGRPVSTGGLEGANSKVRIPLLSFFLSALGYQP
jgi:hypothetical protein